MCANEILTCEKERKTRSACERNPSNFKLQVGSKSQYDDHYLKQVSKITFSANILLRVYSSNTLLFEVCLQACAVLISKARACKVRIALRCIACHSAVTSNAPYSAVRPVPSSDEFLAIRRNPTAAWLQISVRAVVQRRPLI
jgi:hypothetical protein